MPAEEDARHRFAPVLLRVLVQQLLLQQRTIEIQRRLAVRSENVGIAHGIDWKARKQTTLHQFSDTRRERLFLSSVSFFMRQGIFLHLRIFRRLVNLVP